MQALLEKLITAGRSTPGVPQSNDIKVHRHPGKPQALKTKSKIPQQTAPEPPAK